MNPHDAAAEFLECKEPRIEGIIHDWERDTLVFGDGAGYVSVKRGIEDEDHLFFAKASTQEQIETMESYGQH